MADEAVIIELHGDEGNVHRYTIADGNVETKGAFMTLISDNTVSGQVSGGLPQNFSGFLVEDKVASDGATNVGVYTNGDFDLKCSGLVKLGESVIHSGANLISGAGAGAVNVSGGIVGIARESGTPNETIRVSVNL